jgi:hypothetical protein
MEKAFATDVPHLILLELLAFLVVSLFGGDFFCPTRPKAVTDHSHPPTRS